MKFGNKLIVKILKIMITDYDILLQNPKWFEKRRIILERDGNKCSCCGNKNILQVHHKQYHKNVKTGEKQFPWMYENKYLITLCKECHSKGHEKFRIPIFNI